MFEKIFSWFRFRFKLDMEVSIGPPVQVATPGPSFDPIPPSEPPAQKKEKSLFEIMKDNPWLAESHQEAFLVSVFHYLKFQKSKDLESVKNEIVEIEAIASISNRNVELYFNPVLWSYAGAETIYTVIDEKLACPRASLKIDRIPLKNGMIDEDWIKIYFRNNFSFTKDYSLVEGRNYFLNKKDLHKNFEKELSQPLQKVG